MAAGFPQLFTVPLPHERIEAETLVLRQPVRGDYAQWAALRARSRDFLAPWEPLWTEDELTPAAFRRRLRRLRLERAEDEGYSFFLIRRSDNALLGGLNLSHVRRGVAQTASLGYWMGVDHAGQGLMREALRAALPYCFGPLGLHRVEAACLPRNIRSRALLERCGFREEGLARAYLKINGVYEDHVLFARLASDPFGPAHDRL